MTLSGAGYRRPRAVTSGGGGRRVTRGPLTGGAGPEEVRTPGHQLILGRYFYIFWLEPITIDKTKEHMQMYYVGNESANGEELKELREENMRFWKDVMLEDVSAIEGMQEGRNSPVYNGGNFSPVMDQPTHQFHKWIANSLL